MRGTDNGSTRGAASTGPRLLMMSTDRCPIGAGWHARRNGAGDDCSCAIDGRSTKTSPSQPAAANCNRRRCSLRICGNQHSNAPKLALFNTCSAAQIRSFCLSAAMRRMLFKRMPSACSAPACGVHGGASRTNVLPDWLSEDKAGASRRHSPMPGPASSNSVKADEGQPLPGSSLSSAA